MNKFLLTSLAAGLALGCILPASAQPSAMTGDGAAKRLRQRMMRAAALVPPAPALGWVVRDRGELPLGLVRFSADAPMNLTSLFRLTDKAYAGVMTPDGYFFYRFHDDAASQDMQPLALSTVDPQTGAVTDIADWKDKAFIFNDMAYDRKNGKCYAIAREFYTDDFLTALQFEYSALYEVSLTTGVATRVKQFIDWANAAMNNPCYLTLTCDLDGNLFAIDANGYLVKLDRDNDWAEVRVGDTGRRPAQRLQTMDYDPTTDMIYWAADYSTALSDLCLVNPRTAETEVAGLLGTDSRLAGLALEYATPGSGAPAGVADLAATHDASGATRTTVSFTLPTKTFGGTNLPSVTGVTLKRGQEVVKTWTSAQPGASLEYADDPGQSGAVTYTVTVKNALGDGLAKCVTTWAGRDVPDAVTDVGIGRNDDGSALVVWTAPDGGLHGGWVDSASLRYDVVRMPGNTLVAAGLDKCEFTDRTVTTMSRYRYVVTPYTADGRGPEASSVEIELGNVIAEFPYNCLFKDQSVFDTWTVDDRNGGSTWSWKQRGLKDYDGFAMYSYDNNQTADDYLWSPPLALKKGSTYSLKFNYRGSNANYKETFEAVYRAEGGEPQVLKSYTTQDGDGRFDTLDLPAPAEDGTYRIGFHATSPKGQYNLYITDVTVDRTGGEDPGPGPDPELKPVTNLQASVNNGDGSVTLSWAFDNGQGGGDEPDEPGLKTAISEDWESYPDFVLNPSGRVAWSYVDGDGGKPYTSDYADMPYPTDGQPLAAMIMNPYELGSYVYTPNPAHSGEKYLLFKSNFAAGDGTRPAPKPDDYLISPKLDYGRDFVFSFYCKADPDFEGQEAGDFWGPLWNTEKFRVGYSTTGNKPADFIWLSDEPESVTNTDDSWKLREYAIPAAAKYVCINYCTEENGFWFMVDDIYIGLPQTASKRRASAKEPVFKHFSVALNGEKSGETSATSYRLSQLADGSYTATVTAVYEEGESDPATVAFTVELSGIEELEAEGVKVVDGGVESASAIDVYTLDGRTVATGSRGFLPLEGGIYLLRTPRATLKVLVK